jgi:hypothetical protein
VGLNLEIFACYSISRALFLLTKTRVDAIVNHLFACIYVLLEGWLENRDGLEEFGMRFNGLYSSWDWVAAGLIRVSPLEY